MANVENTLSFSRQQAKNARKYSCAYSEGRCVFDQIMQIYYTD